MKQAFYLLLLVSMPAFGSESNASGDALSIFVAEYLSSVKEGNLTTISEVTRSNHPDVHLMNSALVKKWHGSDYKIEIAPYNKGKEDFTAMALELSHGNCGFSGTPTHEVKVIWKEQRTNYSNGHACYSVVIDSAEISLFISKKNGIIEEHSYCKKEHILLATENNKEETDYLDDEQRKEIKQWLTSQPHFSGIKSKKHIKSKYGVSSNTARAIVDSVCKEL